jgi:hypothetical protein
MSFQFQGKVLHYQTVQTPLAQACEQDVHPLVATWHFGGIQQSRIKMQPRDWILNPPKGENARMQDFLSTT